MAISAEEIRRMRAEEEHAKRNSSMTAPDSFPITEEDQVGEGSSYPNAKARADDFATRGTVLGSHSGPTVPDNYSDMSPADRLKQTILGQQANTDQALEMDNKGLGGQPMQVGNGVRDVATGVEMRNASPDTRTATEQAIRHAQWQEQYDKESAPEPQPAPMPAPQATQTDPETGEEKPIVGPRAPETRPGVKEPDATAKEKAQATVNKMTGGQLIDAANNAELSDLSEDNSGADAVRPSVQRGNGDDDEAYQQWLAANGPNKYNGKKPTGQFRMYSTGKDAEGNEIIPGKTGYDLWLEDMLELDMTDGFSPEENNAWDAINNSMRKPGGKSMDEVMEERHLMDQTARERSSNLIPDVDATSLSSPDMSANESARAAYIEQLKEKQRRQGYVETDENGEPILDKDGKTVPLMPSNLDELSINAWMHGTGTKKKGGNTVFNPLGGRDGRGSTARRGWKEDAFTEGSLNQYMNAEGWAQLSPQDRRDLVGYMANQMGWVDPKTGNPINPNSSQQEYYRAKRAVFANKMQTAANAEDRAWLDEEAQLGENLMAKGEPNRPGADMPYYENVYNDNTGQMELQIPLDRRKDQELRRSAAFFARGLKGHSKMPLMTDEDGRFDPVAAERYVAERMGLDPDNLTEQEQAAISWGMNNLRDAQQHLNTRQQLMDRGQGQLLMNHAGDAGDWLQAGAYQRELEEADGDLEQMAMVARKYNNTDDLNTFLEQMTGQAEAQKEADYQERRSLGKQMDMAHEAGMKDKEQAGETQRQTMAANDEARAKRTEAWDAAHASGDPAAISQWYTTHAPKIVSQISRNNGGGLPTYEEFQGEAPGTFLSNYAGDMVKISDDRSTWGWLMDVLAGEKDNPALNDEAQYRNYSDAFRASVIKTLGLGQYSYEDMEAAGWLSAIDQAFDETWFNAGGTPFWEQNQPNTNGAPIEGPQDEITEEEPPTPAPPKKAPSGKAPQASARP